MKRPDFLWIILASATLTVMAGAIIGPVIKEIGTSLGVGISSAGLLVTVPGLFVFLSSPFVGRIIDKVGFKKTLVAGLIFYGISGGAGLIISSYPALLVTRALLGIAVSLIFISVTVSILTLYDGNERNRIMGFRTGISSMSSAVWPLVGGALGVISWHLPFGIYLIGIPLGLLALKFIPNLKRSAESPKMPTKKNAKDKLTIFMIFFLMMLTNMLLYSNIIYMPELLSKIGIINTFYVGTFLSAMALTSGITGSRYHSFKKNLKNEEVLPISFLAWTIGYGLIFFLSEIWTYYLGLIFFGFGYGLILPTIMIWIGDIVPKQSLGKFSAYNTSFGFLGHFLAPVIFSLVTISFGFKEVFLTASIISLTGLLIASGKIYWNKIGRRL